jgi:hypothetical protein
MPWCFALPATTTTAGDCDMATVLQIGIGYGDEDCGTLEIKGCCMGNACLSQSKIIGAVNSFSPSGLVN